MINTVIPTHKDPQDKHKFNVQPDAADIDNRTVVLNHSNSFAVLDKWGNITPTGKKVQGIYHRGTRFINNLSLTIDDKNPLLLGSTIKENNNILSVDLTNPVLKDGQIAENTIHIFRHQFLRSNALFEKITCVNYNEIPCSFELNFFFDGDFKDIFEIRGTPRMYTAEMVDTSIQHENIRLRYKGRDNIIRECIITFSSPQLFETSEGRFRCPIRLNRGEEIVLHYSIHFIIGNAGPEKETFDSAKKKVLNLKRDKENKTASIESNNILFNSWLNRSYTDLFSLYAASGGGNYPFAGVPWYHTPFGRDGIITAMETLWIAPSLAKDVLAYLAATQASVSSPLSEAEPGKIIHEAREGEMANTNEIPFRAYYGTVDATPLFIMLAGMYFERTNDLSFISGIWVNILKALEWIDNYGDTDNDGFVEYNSNTTTGLSNQGWKDSYDAVMHEDGSLAEGRIALCEVQGYVYSAKRYAAVIATAMHKTDLVSKLLKEAATLKERFNECFWDERMRYYVLALDGLKRPCRVIASNAAHCLFTRIADEDKASGVAAALLRKDMYSGWGIRTLSQHADKYNPMSYHNGSIWPHDNALAAYGLSQYGYRKKALKIFEGFFEASAWIDLHRLPELFCGFSRRTFEGPTNYPVACSPQAWSVASIFLFLQTCLGMRIDAVKKVILLNKPMLPAFADNLWIRHLPLAGNRCDLHLYTKNNRLSADISHLPDQWKVQLRQ